MKKDWKKEIQKDKDLIFMVSYQSFGGVRGLTTDVQRYWNSIIENKIMII